MCVCLCVVGEKFTVGCRVVALERTFSISSSEVLKDGEDLNTFQEGGRTL